MNKMDLLNRCSKISIISLLNSVNTIYAKDLGVYTRLGSNVFTFQQDGKDYSFMVLDFKVNGNNYLLSGNEKLKDLILNNLPEDKIEAIKREILDAYKLGEDKSLKNRKFRKLIARVKVVKLDSAQAGNGDIKYVIKDNDGSYYRYYDDFLKKENKFYLENGFRTQLWVEDSYSSETIYVIDSLKIDNKYIDKELKLCNAVSASDGIRINGNLDSWCNYKDFTSFGKLNTDMNFKKLILSYYEKEYGSDKLYESYRLGYLSDTLEYYVTKFKQQLQSFIDNDTEYELFVELIKKEGFDYSKEHYVSIKVRPNMTYGQLFRAVIKKCREIEKLSDDSSSIRDNNLWINNKMYKEFEDIVALSKNNNKIKADIKELKFEYWIYKFEFDPKDKKDMFWKELNGLCKNEEEKPEENKPEVNKPEVNKPEVKKPEVNKPEVNKPEVNKPEVNKPEVKKEEKEKNGGCCNF